MSAIRKSDGALSISIFTSLVVAERPSRKTRGTMRFRCCVTSLLFCAPRPKSVFPLRFACSLRSLSSPSAVYPFSLVALSTVSFLFASGTAVSRPAKVFPLSKVPFLNSSGYSVSFKASHYSSRRSARRSLCRSRLRFIASIASPASRKKSSESSALAGHRPRL